MPSTDDEGYLIDPEEWTEAWASETARALGIDLGEDHWRVIRFMREYYHEHRVAADARHAMRELARHGTPDARRRMFELFPYGYVAQACRIAGMKRPRAWSTG